MAERADSLAVYAPFTVGRGTTEVFSVANPAAGANLSRVSAQGNLERIRTLTFQLVTDATAAVRTVVVELQDADGNRFAGVALADTQAASTTIIYYFGIGIGVGVRAGQLRYSYPLPDVWMEPGWRLATSIVALAGGDQISAVRGYVEKVSLGPDGYPEGETAQVYTQRGRGYARALESE